MLTADTSSELRQLGRTAGAPVWLVKPFEATKLVDVIQRLVGRQ